jgi:zinc transport system substrate-binding protein
MKRKGFGLFLCAIFIFFCSACGIQTESSGKLRVVASFYPIYDLAHKIGRDKIELVNMLPAGAEVHHWEPAPRDMAALEQSDVFLYNGLGMEHWVEDILEAIQTENLLVVETAKDVFLLPSDDGHAEKHGNEDGHNHGAYDPHTWLSPQNAKKQMENIKNVLMKADPDNAETYEANYAHYAKQFDELDLEFQAALAKVSKQDVVVTHRAFAYLCHAYGLRQIGLEGVSHDSEPSPDQLRESIQFIQENDVTTVFYEQSGNATTATTIARETGVKIASLSTLEFLTSEQQAAGDDYFSIMRQNIAALKEALQ